MRATKAAEVTRRAVYAVEENAAAAQERHVEEVAALRLTFQETVRCITWKRQ